MTRHRWLPLLIILAFAGLVAVGCTDDAGGDEATSISGFTFATPAPGEGIRTGGAIGQPVSAEHLAIVGIDVFPGGPMPEGSGSVTEGARVYAVNCARCHGPTGTEAGVGPALVSEPGPWEPGDTITVGSYWPYAETVFDYIRRAMPFDVPGTLTNDEVYSVVAWILAENEIIDEDAVLDGKALRAVEMPNRESFFSCWPDECRPDTATSVSVPD